MGINAGKGIIFAFALMIFSAFVLFVTAEPAAAAGCSPSVHCYGDAVSGISGVHGVAVSITPSCLTVPADRIITNEAWLLDDVGSYSYWVEVGYMQLGAGAVAGSGSKYIINTAGRYGFWEDSRPDHSEIDAHVLQNNPSLTAGAFVSIYANGANAWHVAFNGYSSNSSGNSMIPNNIEVGSESQSASATDYALGTGVEYQDSGGTWHNGMGSPTVPTPTSPQRFTWVTKSTSYHAGIPC